MVRKLVYNYVVDTIYNEKVLILSHTNIDYLFNFYKQSYQQLYFL